ncbi:hypothetical protein BUE93_09125 [Chromobacterium amazonense]|uniref:Acyl carrier protein n=1 Tax=Chromobacterium amazonense TaxID=1382803 RepID=A0A2S9X5M2_9NEIS|nr:acyl carrier protein [Chromobacterium amazonense]PRP70975.1 hypothetical protein BUE93_09125 [Chromobacterium amazonense]
MEDVDIEERVKAVMVAHLSLEEAQLLPQASLVDQLYLDSLDLLDLVLALNDAFGIDIGAKNVFEIKTVGDVYQLVRRLLAQDRVASREPVEK